jgi:DNA (cytosine-5)-methyltransferase 1
MSARFVEWLMGLPDGHVTQTNVKHAAQLHVLGNGVVPRQAEMALRHLHAVRGRS